MNLSIFYPLLAAVPVGLLAVILNFWRRSEKANGHKEPIDESNKFLRTPGQSAFKKADEFGEKIEDAVTWFTVLPSMFLVGFLALKTSGQTLPPLLTGIVIVGIALAFIFAASRLIYLVKQRQKWHLGFRGERAVGEYLNQLMLDGCRVFHDFPLNGHGNLDHIVVAPSGVYAIETKTKSKRAHVKDNYIVKYDGKKLIFPDGWTDTEDLYQAYKQANQLRGLLRDTLDIPINVEPILTFPGWFVKTCALGDVQVLNPKQIRTAIVETDPILSPAQIQIISAYLDTRCRDMEF